MEGFVCGSLGRPWAIHRRDHWSQFVVQVMERAASERWMYPVQRVGVRSRPRLQLGMPLTSSLSLAAQGAAGLHRRTGGGIRINVAIDEWLRSLEGAGGDDKHGAEDPPNDGVAKTPPRRGGLSLVYVGTFGDRPLDELPQQ